MMMMTHMDFRCSSNQEVINRCKEDTKEIQAKYDKFLQFQLDNSNSNYENQINMKSLTKSLMP